MDGTAITIDNDKYKIISTNDIKIVTDDIGNLKTIIDYEISIEPTNIYLFSGQTKKLNVTIKTSPSGYENIFSDIISYYSEDSDIATVSDDGIITGINSGTTEVSAVIGNKADTSTVTVQDNLISVIVWSIFSIVLVALFTLLFIIWYISIC